MIHILKPKRLRPNATFGVITPASPVNEEKLERGIRYFESLGYRIELGRHVHKKSPYLAGTDEERLADFHDMFRNPGIDAIICARGGYGTPRILDRLDYDLIQQNPKIFVGYSDLTALQLAVFKKTGLITYSGPMLAVEFGAAEIDEHTERIFWQMLSEPVAFGKLEPIQRPHYEVLHHGHAEGRLLGGCLALLNCILGTGFLPDFANSILFIEDVGEIPMRIDRYFAQLRHAGILQQTNGIICGQFEDSETEEDSQGWLNMMLEDYFSGLGKPALNKFDYGHIAQKHTMPIGAMARISTAPATVEIIESAVS
ncbi:MAG: LD-carboxypeptidase [Calditrichaeota bacterium]|nr:MAG: LD-carboxypeptidase [Calditrichota bacterium]